MNDIKQNAVMKRKRNDLQNLESEREELNTATLKNQKTRTTYFRKVNGDRAKGREALKKKKKATKILLEKSKATVAKQNETLENEGKKHESQVGSADSIFSSSQTEDSNSGCATGNKDRTIDKCPDTDCGECTVCKISEKNLERVCNKKCIKDPTEERRMEEETGKSDLYYEGLLRFAARTNNLNVIYLLHSIGVSVETESRRQLYCDNFGFYATPLHIAVGHGHVPCVETLIELGANVNAQANFGSTPLHVAIKRDHLPCLELLLKAGADCNLHMYSGSGKADFPSFTTALHLAAIRNRPKCVEYLIKYGADLGAVDINGHTSLYIATRSGFSECVLRHLEHAPRSDFISTPCLESSNTPLHFAVENGMLLCVQKLVRLGADVNHLNNKGLSPLHVLFAEPFRRRHDVMPILKVFVLEGRDLDMKNVLHKNMFLNDWYHEAITFLIAYGASLSITNEWYDFSLFEFIFSKNSTLDLLKFFINCYSVLPLLKSVIADKFRIFELREDTISRGSIPTTSVPVKGLLCDNSLNIVPPQSLRRVLHILAAANPQLKLGLTRLIIPLKQPYLDFLYEIVTEKYEALSAPDGQRHTSVCRDDFRQLQLTLFYEKAATSSPRSLLQCCRFAIRWCMAPANLKRVAKLPLPETLKSYLLFGFHNPNST